MSEIAARSATAVGSLYRFFPTKDSLADALLDRYAGEVEATLSAIHAAAPALDPAGIAAAFVGLALDLQADRAAAIVLVDVRGDGLARRERLRSAMRGGIAGVLRAADPTLDATRAATVAAIALQMLKVAPVLAAAVDGDELLDELRRAMTLYLADRLRAS